MKLEDGITGGEKEKTMKDQGIERLMYVTIEMTKNYNKSMMNKEK